MSMDDIRYLMSNTEFDGAMDVAVANIEALCTPWPVPKIEAIYNIPIMGSIVQLATQNSEVDPMAILATFLCWFGATIGSIPHINVGETKHPPRLYIVLVGASSRARKGTSERPIRRLFKMAEELACIPPLNVTNGPLSSGEGLIHAVRDPSNDKNNIDPGVIDKRLLCIEQEFGNVFKTSRRDGNTLSCTIRTTWDGGTISPLTKQNKICATDPHICIIGHITQAELCRLIRDTDLWNGFANRFLWVCVQRKQLVPFPQPMDPICLNAIAQELANIIILARTRTNIGFTEDASRLWNESYANITEELPGQLGAITARAEAQVLRIAELYALLDEKETIDLTHLQAALAYWQYCSDSVKFLFGNSNIDPDVEKILQALASGKKTTTELHGLFSGHKNGDSLRNILQQLQMNGKIISHAEGGGKRNGRPTNIWELVIR